MSAFSFAVRIGCEDDLVSFFCLRGNVGKHFFFFGYDFIVGNKSALYIYCFAAGLGKIAYMSD